MTTRQKTRVRNVFNNNTSTDLKLFKAQISKLIQSRWFLGSLLSKLSGVLMKVAIPPTKSALASFRITTSIYPGIQKNTWFQDNNFNSFKQRNELHNENFKALEDSNILLKGVAKEQKGEFLGMLLGTLGASLLGNLLPRNGIVRAGSRNKKEKGIVRASYEKNRIFNATSSFNKL